MTLRLAQDAVNRKPPHGPAAGHSVDVDAVDAARTPPVMQAAPPPLWPLEGAARGLWARLATTAVLNSHPAMVRLMRYCQLLAAWQAAMKTVGDKGVAQAIKTGDGRGVREAKLMPHAEWVVRVEAILARLESDIAWRTAP